MIRLMKYEMRKSWYLKAILLMLTAVAQIVFLIGLWADRDMPTAIGVSLLFFLAVTGTVVIGLGTIMVLHRDINTKQSCMLFMTPHSSYAILGAKLLENALSILLISAFFFALGALDITLLFAKQQNLDQLWQMISEMLRAIDQELTIDAGRIAAFGWLLVMGWLLTVVTACLADVLSASLLAGKRFSGLISVLFFVALNVALAWLARKIMIPIRLDFTRTCVLQGCLSLAMSAVMYVATAVLMERKLSV